MIKPNELAKLLSRVRDACAGDPDALAAIRATAAEASQWAKEPIDMIHWVPIEQVQANDYNPNAVATNEMRLLHLSISADGLTQPIVTIFDDKLAKYIIIDGFHRCTTMRQSPDLLARTGGRVPVVVLKKSMNERMAATVRHNRARGKHSIVGMGNIVFSMLDNGASDEKICNELGLEPDELVRLKHVTGFSKLFENVEYRRAWETKRQVGFRTDPKEGEHGSDYATAR